MQPPSGFPKIVRERIGRSSLNLVYITIEQLYTFPENFKSVPTMTFDLWPDFQGHVKQNLRSVPFQRLKLANFGMFAGDMDMDSSSEVTSMVYTDIVTFPRSSEVNDLWCHVIFRVFVPPGVIWCWFWIWHPFSIHMCRNLYLYLYLYLAIKTLSMIKWLFWVPSQCWRGETC